MTDAPRRSTVLGGCVAGLLLLLAAPSPWDAVRDVRGAGSAADPTGPLVAALALVAWALATWLLLTMLLTVAGRLPGAAGRLSGAASRRIAPAVVRRAVEVALGLTVAVGVLGASPAYAAASGTPAPAPPATAPARPSLDWPAPAPPADLDGSATEAAPPVVAPVAAPADAVVVRPGDTLWGLAEQSLRSAGAREPTDREVAQAWPAWWSANRGVVGDDPDLLRPGTSLTPPDAGAAGPSSS